MPCGAGAADPRDAEAVDAPQHLLPVRLLIQYPSVVGNVRFGRENAVLGVLRRHISAAILEDASWISAGVHTAWTTSREQQINNSGASQSKT